MSDATPSLTPELTKKQVKQPWTLERCKRAAARFTSEDAWKKGAPSSYKAAVSRGWTADCCTQMKVVNKAPRREKKSA